MAERITHLDPSVEIVKSDTGLLMTTTETKVTEEVFLDVTEAKKITNGRFKRDLVKTIATVAAGTGFAIFGISGVFSLYDDLTNTHPEYEVRDVETMILGAAGVVAAAKYSNKLDVEFEVWDEQEKRLGEAEDLPGSFHDVGIRPVPPVDTQE